MSARPPSPAGDHELADDESLVELRCSVVVTRGHDVLLLRRMRGDVEEWVLPGGRPRHGEGMLACARREVDEETGLSVIPQRCAFVADVIDPGNDRRRAELVFVAKLERNHPGHSVGEDGAEPVWVPVDRIRHLNLLPPIAGFLPGVVSGYAETAPYLGNLWRGGGLDDRDETGTRAGSAP